MASGGMCQNDVWCVSQGGQMVREQRGHLADLTHHGVGGLDLLRDLRCLRLQNLQCLDQLHAMPLRLDYADLRKGHMNLDQRTIAVSLMHAAFCSFLAVVRDNE